MGTVSIARSSPRQEYKMHLIFLSVALVCASALELEDIANVRKGSEGTDVSNNRKPKLFFVSSASTTSTVKTDAVCYVQPALPVSPSPPVRGGGRGLSSPRLWTMFLRWSRLKLNQEWMIQLQRGGKENSSCIG